MTDHVSVSRSIAADPSKVWGAITDVTRMGEWSPECHTCEWKDGATGPAVGVHFIGHNRNGDFEWTTEAEIVECVPEERFVFEGVFGDIRFSRWGYTIEPSDEGCVVTEFWDDLRSQMIKDMGESISGVADRLEHNRAGMEQTLARVAAAVE